MPKPKKDPEDRANESNVAMQEPPGPIPVRVVPDPRPAHPQADKFPMYNKVNERPKKRYKFIHNQQPGTPLDATVGVTVVKATGQLGTVDEKYHLDDGEEYDIPVDIVQRWKTLTYDENGKKRVRFVFEEV